MLCFRNFRKSYGSFTVLKINDLLINPGIFWIRGANGSGKSTFLKTIGGIIDFDGDILLHEGISIKKHPIAYRRLVNFAEAEPVFPEFLTGNEMIRLFAAAKDAPAGQEEYFLESMNMYAYINEPVGTYSSGMLKKLSILLAFLGNPKIILLDEPFITLDTPSLKILQDWITAKHHQENVSFLLSSHQSLGANELTVSHELLVEMQTVKLTA